MKKNKLIDVSKYIFEDYFIFDILPAVNDEDSSSEGRMPWSYFYIFTRLHPTSEGRCFSLGLDKKSSFF